MAKRRGPRVTGKAGPERPDSEAQPAAEERTPSTAAEGTTLHSRIAARAYALFLARGGQHGDAWADWLQAEREVLAEERPAPDPEGP